MRGKERRWLVAVVALLAAGAYAVHVVRATTERDQDILAQAIKLAHRGRGLTVVRARTVSPADMGGTGAKARQMIVSGLNLPGCDARRLVGALYRRNLIHRPVPLVSAPSDGYLAYEGGRYTGDPRVTSETSVSLPVHDSASHVVLLYITVWIDQDAATGWIAAYRYDHGQLKEIDRVLVWVS